MEFTTHLFHWSLLRTAGAAPKQDPEADADVLEWAGLTRRTPAWREGGKSTTMIEVAKRTLRARAVLGWTNWHLNRGRLPHHFTKAELRRVSWRRAH